MENWPNMAILHDIETKTVAAINITQTQKAHGAPHFSSDRA
jgi:hypothetical protein